MKKKTQDKLVGLFYLLLGGVYLLNFGFGLVEFLPDNLPIIGNVDEGLAGALFYLGIKKIMGKG